MNTCDTCKWWNRDGYIERREAGYGICKHPKLLESYAWSKGSEHHPSPADGFYVDSGDYASSDGHLETGSKFGCIHHESK